MLPLPSLLVVPPEVMLCVGECTAGGRTGGAEEERWSTAPLPPLAEIDRRVIRAEALNVRNFDAFARANVGWRVPQDLHPLSLHAHFQHNTDIVLTRGDSDAVTRGAPVSMQVLAGRVSE